MTVDIKDINLTLLTAFKNSNFVVVNEKSLQTANATKLQTESLLESDQTISGIKSISNINVAPSIAQLETVIPVTIVNDSDDSAISLITGTSAKPGSLNTVIVSGAPQAVGKSLASVTNKTAYEYRNTLDAIAVPDAKAAIVDIDNILTNGVDKQFGLSQIISEYNNNFNNILGSATNTLIGNCILKIQNGVLPIIDDIAPLLSLKDKDDVIKLLLSNRKREAVQVLEKLSGVSADTIEEKIKDVPISLKEVVNEEDAEVIGTKTTPDYELVEQEKKWEGADTPVNGNVYTFDIVGSKEELIAEFRESTRDITEFVAHWTGTFTNQPIGARDVHSWHINRGWSGCGYHYIIQRDGKMQRGRPINIQGAHSAAYGHNKYSIGVSFVGGFNCPTGTTNPDRFLSSDSFTNEQWNSFSIFTEAFYAVWPGGQAWGHNDTTDQGKIDPGFDVQQYVFNKFNKENIYTNGKNPASALASKQLEAARARVT